MIENVLVGLVFILGFVIGAALFGDKSVYDSKKNKITAFYKKNKCKKCCYRDAMWDNGLCNTCDDLRW